jgi:hypothetical protein
VAEAAVTGAEAPISAGGTVTDRKNLQSRRDHELKLRRRQRLAEAAWKLGPRAYYELLCDLDRHYELPDVDVRLAAPSLLAAFGSDRFPPSPMRIIGGDR